MILSSLSVPELLIVGALAVFLIVITLINIKKELKAALLENTAEKHPASTTPPVSIREDALEEEAVVLAAVSAYYLKKESSKGL